MYPEQAQSEPEVSLQGSTVAQSLSFYALILSTAGCSVLVFESGLWRGLISWC